MRHTRPSRRRAMMLVEVAMSIVLTTGVIVAGMRAVVTARHLSERDAVMTQLYAAAQTEVARLSAADWGALAEGERTLTPEELSGLGLDRAAGLSGAVAVRAVPGLDLREIAVRLERPTASGQVRASLATWRGKEMP